MKRFNFTLDDSTVDMLSLLADKHFQGNKSLALRSAIETLASRLGEEGWIVEGYSPVLLHEDARCMQCGETHHAGDEVFRPVFKRGRSDRALKDLPKGSVVVGPDCIDEPS